jgi:peptide deformylase
MAERKILQYPDEESALRRVSERLKKNDPQIQTLGRDLVDTLLANPGAGLSAPQIGIHKRIAAVRFGQEDGEMKAPVVLVNPQIVERGPLATGFDGCLSIPGFATWDTPRPSWLVFTARDELWKPIRMKVEGIDARLVDHEIDHLDGKLFLDLLLPDSKLYFAKKDENGAEQLIPVTSLMNKAK